MFDNLKVRHEKLPKEFWGHEFQTKDLPSMFLDNYEIREDGKLYYEEYDIEDRSDPNAEGIEKFFGCMSRENKRWVEWKDKYGYGFHGEIVFYDVLRKDPNKQNDEEDYWIEFSSFFVTGKLKELHLLKRHKMSEFKCEPTSGDE